MPGIDQDLDKVLIRLRQHRHRDTRAPRWHRQHPDRRGGSGLHSHRPRDLDPHRDRGRTGLHAIPARLAEDLRDRLPGDLQPGQTLLGLRQTLVQRVDLTPEPVRLLARGRFSAMQLFDQRTHPTATSLPPETVEATEPSRQSNPQLRRSTSHFRRATRLSTGGSVPEGPVPGCCTRRSRPRTRSMRGWPGRGWPA